MKRWPVIIAAFIILAGCADASELSSPGPASAVSWPASVSSSQADAQQSFALSSIGYPLLVTSLGQSTDGLLVREMLSDVKADYTYDAVVAPEELENYKTVLLAVGASSKALGSLGRTTEAEFDRCKTLLQAIPDETVVVLVRLGDSASQDSLTDALLDLALPYADAALVTQHSDREGKIVKFAADHDIPCSVSDSVRQMTEVFSTLLCASQSAQ